MCTPAAGLLLQAQLCQGVGVQGKYVSVHWLQVFGEVDQSAGMLDEGAKAKGYALLCVSEPKSDCRIRVIDEVCLVR